MQVTHARRKPKTVTPKTQARGFLRSPCAVACTLDLVGDKWSLLVVRDLLRGNVTYGELQSSPEGIPTNILADRLKRLEEARLIAKSAYQNRPVRYAYRLTENGKALNDVLLALVRWGKKHIPGTRTLESPTLHSARGRKPTRLQDRKSHLRAPP
ncbi:MAG: helix-turn-helix domain-containing protein [Candidatus Binataceae bacterium]